MKRSSISENNDTEGKCIILPHREKVKNIALNFYVVVYSFIN